MSTTQSQKCSPNPVGRLADGLLLTSFAPIMQGNVQCSAAKCVPLHAGVNCQRCTTPLSKRDGAAASAPSSLQPTCTTMSRRRLCRLTGTNLLMQAMQVPVRQPGEAVRQDDCCRYPVLLPDAHRRGAVAARPAVRSRPVPLLSGAAGGGGARSPGRTHPGCCAMSRSSTSASASSCLHKQAQQSLCVASTRPDVQQHIGVSLHGWSLGLRWYEFQQIDTPAAQLHRDLSAVRRCGAQLVR